MSSLSLSLIQTALAWEDKAANLQHLERQLAPLRGKTQIVVLPELFSTGFSMQTQALAEPMEGPTVQWMRTMAQQHQCIITGSIMIQEKEYYYNRLIWMLPTGELGYYDKRHLFAFAGEDRHYHRGAKRLIASANGFKINLQICYDLRFPVWSRQRSMDGQPEYDLLIYVANWPERRRLAWMSLLQARAIENQCYVIGVNRVGEDGHQIYHSGDSMVIDPLGEILFTKKDDACVHTVTISKESLQNYRRQFPFLRDGDAFELLP
ncbi:MAG: amidohydrolase [Sphingomonadales bacterium]